MKFMSAALDRKSFLDPRTKLLILLMVSLFVMSSFGGSKCLYIMIFFSYLPYFLLLVERKIRVFIKGIILLLIGNCCLYILKPITTGFLNSIVIMTGGVLVRFCTTIMMASYLISTTTVSQFMCAMERMHLPPAITIPLSVMFRFFPTVGEESSSINKAMTMRDIRFGGKKIGKMIEYRLIPMMTCSVRIGQELSAASLSRGLGGNVKRTNICKIGFGFFDYLFQIICYACFIFAILVKFGIF